MERNENHISYYKVLEISRKATPEMIRRAFKKLALKYHPDKNSDSQEASEKFLLVKEAYETLSNEKRKAAYDNSLSQKSSTMFSAKKTQSERYPSSGKQKPVKTTENKAFEAFIDSVEQDMNKENERKKRKEYNKKEVMKKRIEELGKLHTINAEVHQQLHFHFSVNAYPCILKRIEDFFKQARKIQRSKYFSYIKTEELYQKNIDKCKELLDTLNKKTPEKIKMKYAVTKLSSLDKQYLQLNLITYIYEIQTSQYLCAAGIDNKLLKQDCNAFNSWLHGVKKNNTAHYSFLITLIKSEQLLVKIEPLIEIGYIDLEASIGGHACMSQNKPQSFNH